MKDFFRKRHSAKFYTVLLSQLLVAVQLILAIFGYQDLLDAALQHKILSAADALFLVLGTVGVFVNPIKQKDGE